MIFIVLLLLLCPYVIACIIVKYKCSWEHTDCKSKVCLVGKTALVTGGSQGIGYEIVLGLASRGCRVIIADCKIDESIKDAIYKETHNPNVTLKYVNLASFKSVREFADDIRNTEDKIDILINNAGVGTGVSVITEDGINLTMQVNYYSAFLLTHLLLDLLKKSESGARVLFTSSFMSYFHPLTVRSLRGGHIEKGYEFASYSISKFCQVCASDILAEKLLPYGITSNCFHPYAANTNIYKNTFNGKTWYEIIGVLFLYFGSICTGKTAEEGAQSGIYLACANEAKDINGEFIGNLAPSWRARGSRNKEMKESIWKISESVVKLKPEERICS